MDNTKNVVGLVIFIIILLLFVVGGYFLMDYMLNNYSSESNNNGNGITEVKEIRIDATKDYIYYENSTDILHEEHIVKEDVVINIKGFEATNTSLAEELESFSQEQVLIPDADIPEGSVCTNEENLYSFPYREYEDTVFGDYISLVINDFTYNCLNGSRIDNIKGYVIDRNTGEIISEETLLDEFAITEDDILTQVRERLNDTQVLDGDTQVIDIEGTISDIASGEYGTVKSLSVSKTGELVINFIVKSNRINYNDSIELIKEGE